VQPGPPSAAPPDLAAGPSTTEIDNLVVQGGPAAAATNAGRTDPIEAPVWPLVGALGSGSSGGSGGSQTVALTEPGAWVLLGSGLIGLAWARRRRRTA
jgi:hypothetical protein